MSGPSTSSSTTGDPDPNGFFEQCPVWFERLLLLLTVGLKFWVLHNTWNVGTGFDACFLAERVGLVETTWNPPMHDHYHSYHPFLAYVIIFGLIRLGFKWENTEAPISATQVAGTLSSVIALLFLRAMVCRMGMQRRWSAIALVYGVTSLPLVISAATEIAIDIHILTAATAVLYFAVAIYFPKPGAKPVEPDAKPGRFRWWLYLGLVCSLAVGMLFKFSALLVFALPPLVALAAQRNWKVACKAVLPPIVAGLVILPYYYDRYYKETGQMLPCPNDWFMPDLLKESRAWRDEHKVEFLLNFIKPSPPVAQWGPQARDRSAIHFTDLWRDLWTQNDHLGLKPISVNTLGILYWVMATPLIFLGVLTWRGLWRKRDPMAALGVAFAGMFVIEIAAWAYYAWTQPIPRLIVAKGIYVLPIAWSVIYFQALLADSRSKYAPNLSILARYSAPFVIVGVLVINHLLPVY